MTDTVTAMNMLHAILLCECIADFVMAHIVLLACRNEVIVDHHNLVRVPDFFKSHLVKFIYDKRHHDVVEHDTIDIDRHDLARLYALSADVVGDDLLNNCLSHLFFSPILKSVSRYLTALSVPKVPICEYRFSSALP